MTLSRALYPLNGEYSGGHAVSPPEGSYLDEANEDDDDDKLVTSSSVSPIHSSYDSQKSVMLQQYSGVSNWMSSQRAIPAQCGLVDVGSQDWTHRLVDRSASVFVRVRKERGVVGGRNGEKETGEINMTKMIQSVLRTK